MDYVIANAPMMDSVSASNMRHVAIINSDRGALWAKMHRVAKSQT